MRVRVCMCMFVCVWGGGGVKPEEKPGIYILESIIPYHSAFDTYLGHDVIAEYLW